jgi:NTP pyrophosphatase (non-canonical NTP hydrolase)
MTSMDEVQALLDWFRVTQEQKFAANVHKTHWLDVGAPRLLAFLVGEVGELVEAMGEAGFGPFGGDEAADQRVREEAADVANFAAMIAYCYSDGR